MARKKIQFYLHRWQLVHTLISVKKENRDKAQVAFNNMKTKVESFIESQKTQRNPETKTGHPDPYDTQDSTMVSEGAQTSVHYYNQEIQDESKEDSDGLYKSNDEDITENK